MRTRVVVIGLAAIWMMSVGSGNAQECINNTNPGNCPGSFTFAAKTCGVGDPVCTNPSDPAMPPECCVSGVPGGTGGNACQPGGCNGVNDCRTPDVPAKPTTQIIDNGNGTFTARLKFDVTARWNAWAASQNPAGILTFEWMPGGTVDSCNSNVALCQYAQSDRAACWIEQTGLTCAGAPYDFGQVSARISTCSGSFGGCFCQSSPPVFCPCWRKVDRPGLSFKVSKTRLKCLVPLPDPCTAHADPTGASGQSCTSCQPAGPGWWSSDDGGLSGEPGIGNSQLRYAAGGVGDDDTPGMAAWRTAFGRFWTHDYAERIVLDPDVGHVWLLTRHGGFHEFDNLEAGSGLHPYQSVAPADEFRKLYYDTATATWQLRGLDGTTEFFRTDGQWDKTASAQDPTHPIQGAYDGSNQLISVTFPDGHSDSFTYLSGRLASIRQVAVPGTGTASRTWTFSWVGDELTEASRPDGTSYVFSYDPARTGYLTRVDLVAGGQHRVIAAFSYLAGTNKIEKTWRGEVNFTDANAIDKTAYSYTSATETVVTRTVSPTFDRVTTFTLDHVATSNNKLRVTGFTGSCPTCGLSPTTSFTFGGSNPLLPSAMTDGRGTRTDFTYTAEGRLQTKTEAANVPALTRTTAYTYDANFPGLVTRVEVPSTSGGSNKRRTDSAYDATTGVLTSRTIDGFEAGAALPAGFKTTTFTANASGEILTVDPPGFSTGDVTSFTYNLTGRNGHVADTRTDPLVGTTAFGYDGLNRRVSVTDVNNVQTTNTYDSMNRITEVRQHGATSGEDLVTAQTYDGFGNLFCTKLPRGNGIEYDYDAAGRLIAVVRGTAVTSPSASSCLDSSLARERSAYHLDGEGNRIEESLERWSGASWVSDSRTSYVYTCHLDKMTQGSGSATPSVTEYCHDVNDNLEGVWDANHPKATHPNATQAYEYDELNRLKKVTTGLGTATAAPTSYTYDVQDHLASVTDAEGNQTTYTTSDRDLLTEEISLASGTTDHTYDAHGERLITTDARAIVAERTVDAAGRVTQETFGPSGSPDPTLTTTYTYGTTPLQFDVGRLISITRGQEGDTFEYTYDRFGRMLQDGSVAYEYDKNGYRTQITYPSGIIATYAPDFADRDSSLDYDDGSGSQPLVTAAGYLAGGPLASLTLGNGIVETRSFDARYFPSALQAGSLLAVDYTVDGVGNPTGVSGALGGNSLTATYSYTDGLYFLSQAAGPWGSRDWSYDRIGNRLTSSGTGLPSWTYQYSDGGHGPRLATVAEPASSTSWAYDNDEIGNETSITQTVAGVSQQLTYREIGGDGRMIDFSNGDEATSSTGFDYDPRGFLAAADRVGKPTSANVNDSSVYTSRGELLALTRSTPGPLHHPHVNDFQFFSFAGRPVAEVSTDDGLVFITTDHLATPVLGTDPAGASTAAGWPEPFRPETSLILQYPGQWLDAAIENPHQGSASSSAIDRLYFNVHRWYAPQTGRYSSVDPKGLSYSMNLFTYVAGRPTILADPLGLAPVTPRFQPGPVPPPTCTNCSPHDSEVGGAVSTVCTSAASSPKCQNALRRYGLLHCFWRKCMLPIPVICQEPCGDTCGGPCINFGPSPTEVVYLSKLTLVQPSICGPLVMTVGHEMAHMCGIGNDVGSDPAMARNRAIAEEVAGACSRP